MIRFVVAFSLSLLFACSTSEKKQQTQAGRGKLKITELSYNFGTLSHGDVVGHNFKVINVGKFPVVIQSVDNGCGCTEVKYTKKPIEPSDTVFVEVIFDTNGLHGRQVKKVTLQANDSIQAHDLLIWAEIK